VCRYDLHSHSWASDGVLSPAALVQHAHREGVQVLALTDHDNVTGIGEAQAQARLLGMQLVPGVEISVTWNRRTIHIVGLDIDHGHPVLVAGLEQLQAVRRWRARAMADRLTRAGVKEAGLWLERQSDTSRLTRTHFARFLVDQGHAGSVQQVFKKWLRAGRTGYVNVQWAGLAEAVAWINAAGGCAVIAHPGRYRMSAAAWRGFVAEFKRAGGVAMEVAYAGCSRDEFKRNLSLAREQALRVSVGSDFHDPDIRWTRLGRLPSLPGDVVPVWRHFRLHAPEPVAGIPVATMLNSPARQPG